MWAWQTRKSWGGTGPQCPPPPGSYAYVHRRRKLLKAGGAQEVVINFELFAVVTHAKLLCGRGRHVKVGGAQAPSAPPVPTPMPIPKGQGIHKGTLMEAETKLLNW